MYIYVHVYININKYIHVLYLCIYVRVKSRKTYMTNSRCQLGWAGPGPTPCPNFHISCLVIRKAASITWWVFFVGVLTIRALTIWD